MSSKIIAIIIVIALGVIGMFTILHFNSKSATSVAQVACIKGDQKADTDATAAKAKADAQTLADTKEQLRQAQIEASNAQRLAQQATSRAAGLDAALDALKLSDATVTAWDAEKIPASLRASMTQGKTTP